MRLKRIALALVLVVVFAMAVPMAAQAEWPDDFYGWAPDLGYTALRAYAEANSTDGTVVLVWENAKVSAFGGLSYEPYGPLFPADYYKIYEGDSLVATTTGVPYVDEDGMEGRSYTRSGLSLGETTFTVEAVSADVLKWELKSKPVLVEYRLPMRASATPSTKLVTFGSTVTIKGRVLDQHGIGLAGASVRPSHWALGLLGPEAISAADGSYTLRFARPLAGWGWYFCRVQKADHWPVNAGGWVISLRPKITAVTGNGSSISHGKTYSFTGYVNPRTTASLRIYKYSSKSRKYLYYKSVSAAVGSAEYVNGYKFTSKWKPSSTGKYRLHWQSGTLAHDAANKSGYRYITVR